MILGWPGELKSYSDFSALDAEFHRSASELNRDRGFALR
jgi:hypothetical protein